MASVPLHSNINSKSIKLTFKKNQLIEWRHGSGRWSHTHTHTPSYTPYTPEQKQLKIAARHLSHFPFSSSFSSISSSLPSSWRANSFFSSSFYSCLPVPSFRQPRGSSSSSSHTFPVTSLPRRPIATSENSIRFKRITIKSATSK